MYFQLWESTENYTLCWISKILNQILTYDKIVKPLAPHRCGFESRQGLWILSCVEAIQLAYGTSVVILGCPFLPEQNARRGTWGLPAPVKLKRRQMTYAVSVWRYTQIKQKQTKIVTRSVLFRLKSIYLICINKYKLFMEKHANILNRKAA
jgi:hypothetical protein